MVNGLTGIANVGNTCYLNSMIQILSHTPNLNNVLTIPRDNEYAAEKVFTNEWCQLRKMLWGDQPGILVPNRFIAHLQHISRHKSNPLFSNFQQNDVHEFLLFILETFHLSISRKMPDNIRNNNPDITNAYKDSYSEIIAMFYGIHVSYIRDMNGEILSKIYEPFSTISIPVSNTPSTIYDCMKNYYAPTSLSGDNSYLHPKTNEKVNATKHLTISTPPNILVIHLNRWNYNGKKLDTMIDSDLTIDLSNLIIGENTYKYKLYGICNHVGNSNGGHYTSNIRRGEAWYNFNDTTIRRINTQDIVSKNAYCFFYYIIK